MKKQIALPVLFLILTTFSSCSVVGGIFKAGMGVGIFAVIAVVVVIIFIITRLGKK